MNNLLKIHNGASSLNNDFPVIYYRKSYLESHQHKQLIAWENSDVSLVTVLENKSAISIPGSPFGSFFVKDTFMSDQFPQLLEEIKNGLKEKGIEELSIKHPPAIYPNFMDEGLLESSGFLKKYADINQQIRLTEDWESGIHTMQKRKLESLHAEKFEFQKMDETELQTAHKFIDVCRRAQDLRINISYDMLKQQFESARSHDIFSVVREGKISALCIAVRVTDEVAYYYLPATSPMFRSQSPMVLLIAGMVEYYRKSGFKYLDLGVSSVEGKPQESLRIFKERMGAEESPKTTWTLPL